MKFIYTINPNWTNTDLLEMLSNGILDYRINAIHLNPDKITDTISTIKNFSDDCNIYFDLPGHKSRIWYFGDNGDKLKINKNQLYKAIYTHNPIKDKSLYLTGFEFFSNLNVGDEVFIRRHQYPLLKFNVTHKNDYFCELKAENDGIVGWGYHIYSNANDFENKKISTSDYKYIELLNILHPDYIALSFTDNIFMLDDLKSKLKYQYKGIYAKIETQGGIKNLNSIIDNAAGVIIARDDLSTFLDKSSIENLTLHIINSCQMKKKISICASNYFSSLCNSIEISEDEFLQLINLKRLNQQLIYCNETNKCSDWKRFRNIELKLNEVTNDKSNSV